MSDFLLELRSEEIPARMQAGARASLEKLFSEQCAAAGLSVGAVTVWSTPRRLALIARNIPTSTEAVSEELKGPRVGAPPQALEGFLRKTGLTAEQLEERGGVYYAVNEKLGRSAGEVLAEAIPAIIRAFPWPKSQRWGKASLSTESLRWVRPLSGIVALLDGEVVNFCIGDIASGNTTRGHRFSSVDLITISDIDSYKEALKEALVIVDHQEREDLIRTRARKIAADAGLVLVEDEGLVIENAGLTEWPVPMLGRFDEAFLEVPPEVIQLTTRINQKYFVCNDTLGKLANAFVCTANIAGNDGGAAIVAGNEKVLAARLSDARFFWQQDRKVLLADQAAKLTRITFHEKLGTVADKVNRVAALAHALVEQGVITGTDAEEAEQAARLAKADLVTEMVGEFPELQGLMGGYYARAEGLGDAISDAIRDHYKPVGQGDAVPTAPVSVAVSLADKLDTLQSFFAIDEKPTGSRDPFALRRAALGVIRLITENNLRFAVAEGELLAFFADRLKVQQKEAGVRHDLIDAVFALGDEQDLVRLLARVHALQALMMSEDGVNLLAGYKRAANILRKEEFQPVGAVTLDYEPEAAERDLIDALTSAGPLAQEAVEQEDFSKAMTALATLRAPIDAFFDTVTVNDADEKKRTMRLSLLAQFRDAAHNFADFSRIEG